MELYSVGIFIKIRPIDFVSYLVPVSVRNIFFGENIKNIFKKYPKKGVNYKFEYNLIFFWTKLSKYNNIYIIEVKSKKGRKQ